VQLDQVEPLGAQPLQRAPDLVPRLPVAALAGLGREEEISSVTIHPRSNPKLGIAVGGCRVDVVDAVLEQEVEHAIGGALVDLAECCAAEDHRRAAMAGPSEGAFLDHISLPVVKCATAPMPYKDRLGWGG
jgi:hypothetical protein